MTEEPPSARFYLDTSAHVERWAGSRAKRGEIRDVLSDGWHATSSHALREWKHIFEHAAAQLLNALDDGTDISELFVQLSQLPGREPKQVLRAISILTRGQTTLDASVRIKARSFLRAGSRQRFNHRLDEVRDGSGCQLARNNVFRHPQGDLRLVWRCRKTDHICDQEAFIATRSQPYDAVGQALINDSPSGRERDVAMGEAAVKAAAAPRDGKGRACYGTLGDVSIAMECRSDETILTTDRSFETMAPALGIAVERISPS